MVSSTGVVDFRCDGGGVRGGLMELPGGVVSDELVKLQGSVVRDESRD
jgi:hypothetical protein